MDSRDNLGMSSASSWTKAEARIEVLAAQEDEDKTPKSFRFKLTVFFLCLISVVAAMDAVIVATALGAVAEDLGSTSTESFWIGTSFLLAQTVTIPLYGSTSEIFGRKWTIIPAIFLFTLGSVLCATAQSVDWLMAARVLQGVGAGGVVQLVQVILSEITTMAERPKYIAMAMAAWALGTNVALPIGGAIATYTTWRWIFWLNLPPCGISMAGLAFSLNLKKDTSSVSTKLARMDWLGIGIFTTATTLFLYGVTAGGISNPWDSAAVLAPTIIGAILFGVFVFVEWRLAKEPMMPLRIFKNRTSIAGFATAFLQGMVVWCVIYYMIIFFLGATQYTLLHSSLVMMNVSAYMTPAAIVASLVIKRTLRFKYMIVTGWVLLAVGMGVNITMQPHSSKAILYAPRVIGSIGAGLLFPTPLFQVQAKQLPNDIGIATSTQVFSRSLGQTFGVAFGGVIFQNQWDRLLPSLNIPAEYLIPSSLAEIAYNNIARFPEAVQEQYRWLYSDSLNAMWWFVVAVCLLGLGFALLSRNEPLRGGVSEKQGFEDKVVSREDGGESGE